MENPFRDRRGMWGLFSFVVFFVGLGAATTAGTVEAYFLFASGFVAAALGAMEIWGRR